MESNRARRVGRTCRIAPLRRSGECRRLRQPETHWHGEKCSVSNGSLSPYSAAGIESRDADPCEPRGLPWLRSGRDRLAVGPAPDRSPPRHHHLVDKRIERDKGVRTRVAGKRDTLVDKELLHDG